LYVNQPQNFVIRVINSWMARVKYRTKYRCREEEIERLRIYSGRMARADPETGKEFPFSPLYLLLAPTVSCSKPLRHRSSLPAHFPHRYRRSSIQVPVCQTVCPVSSLHLPSPAAPLIFFAAISSRSRHINKCHPSPNDKPLVSSTPSRRKGSFFCQQGDHLEASLRPM
jgi:hypothetical protein